MIYVILILSILIFGTLLRVNQGYNRRLFLAVFFFMTTFIMAFRGNSVGIDTMKYIAVYNQVSNLSLSEVFSISAYRMEILFVFLIKITASIIDNYYFFQFVVAAIYCYGITVFLKRNCTDLFFSSIVYICSGLFLGAFNTTREALAIMLAINGWSYLNEKNTRRAIVLLICAVLVHFSAIVFAFGYLAHYLLKKNINLSKWMPLLLCMVLFFYDRIINLAMRFVPFYHNYYSNHKIKLEAGGVIIIWVIITMFALYCLYFDKDENDFVGKIAAIFSIVFIVTNIIGLSFNYFERLGSYFMPFIVILFENMRGKFRSRSVSYLYQIGLPICYIAYFFLSCTSAQYVYSFWF